MQEGVAAGPSKPGKRNASSWLEAVNLQKVVTWGMTVNKQTKKKIC